MEPEYTHQIVVTQAQFDALKALLNAEDVKQADLMLEYNNELKKLRDSINSGDFITLDI